MSRECKIVEDLLPLYHDGICSQESRELVEGHLNKCRNCRERLGQIDGELALPAATEAELKPLKDISKTVKQGKRRALITGVSLALSVVLILFAGWVIRWYTQDYLYYKEFAKGQIPDSVHEFDENGNIIQSVVVNPGKYSWYDGDYCYNVEVPGFLSGSGRVEMIRLEGGEGEHISVSIGRWKDKDYVFHVSYSGTAHQWLDKDGNLYMPYFIVDGDMNPYPMDHWTREQIDKMEAELAACKEDLQQLIEDAKAMWPFVE